MCINWFYITEQIDPSSYIARIEREIEREREMGSDYGGKITECVVKNMPAIKYTKLFINGEFVDSASGYYFLFLLYIYVYI